MERKAISNREDINVLVTRFYEKVREDSEIGHFFNSPITDWAEHIEKLTDFWETNLFFVQKYKANPLQVHVDLDKEKGHKGILLQIIILVFGYDIGLKL